MPAYQQDVRIQVLLRACITKLAVGIVLGRDGQSELLNVTFRADPRYTRYVQQESHPQNGKHAVDSWGENVLECGG